jgi:hypothetical protein
MVYEKFCQCPTMFKCTYSVTLSLFPGSKHQASQPTAQLQIHHKLFTKAQKLLTVNTCFIVDKHSVQKIHAGPFGSQSMCQRAKILFTLLSSHGNKCQHLCTQH